MRLIKFPAKPKDLPRDELVTAQRELIGTLQMRVKGLEETVAAQQTLLDAMSTVIDQVLGQVKVMQGIVEGPQ